MISDSTWSDLLETRATDPGAVRAAHQRRSRRELLGSDGSLFLVAADHPARSALGVGDDAFAMADRRSLLDRLVTALEDPRVDGVLGSPDVLDELALLGALDDKVVIGSMNRSGLQGSAWELDDQLTGHDVAAVVDDHLDGGKMLLRIDPADRDSKATIESCAQHVSGLARAERMAMVEPLPYLHRNGRALLDPSEDALVRCVAVAAGLGATSAYTWLKLPATDAVERVMATTTFPFI